MVGAVGLGNTALLGRANEDVLGVRGADEVCEGLGHERAQAHGQERLGGQEDAREHGFLRAVERVGDRLERHARADAGAGQLLGLGQVARLEPLQPEGGPQQARCLLGLLVHKPAHNLAKDIGHPQPQAFLLSHLPRPFYSAALHNTPLLGWGAS